MYEPLHINANWYFDLETYDDEATATLSLAQLAILAHTVQVPLQTLMNDDTAPSDPQITFPELSERLLTYIRERGISASELENQLGWEVEAALADADSFWLWNVDGLRDLCDTLHVSWLAALPRALPPDGFPKDWPA